MTQYGFNDDILLLALFKRGESRIYLAILLEMKMATYPYLSSRTESISVRESYTAHESHCQDTHLFKNMRIPAPYLCVPFELDVHETYLCREI